MEHKDIHPQDDMWKKWEREHRRGKIFGGIFIVIIGSLFLIREMGMDIPQWIFTWKTLLIGLGLLVGMKNGFRNGFWLICVLTGGAFLLCDLYPALALKPLLWPLLVILFGLFIIFKPRRKHKHHQWEKWHKHYHKHQHYYKDDYFDTDAKETSEDSIDFVSFMSALKKNIVTKNFKGGEITVVFAGAKINLSQADMNETATLEVTQVFGGTQLIIPANWEVRSEQLVCVFGNIEDKREAQPSTFDHNKVLILKGTVVMGGIEIKSH